MPELPEVEITRRGITPVVVNQKITKVMVRNRQLRWMISEDIHEKLLGNIVSEITRRARYLLLKINSGNLLIHLGMSGNLTIAPVDQLYKKHDHFILEFANNFSIRFNDQRRFGAILWIDHDPNQHQLLAKIGPEPFAADFTPEYLYQISRKRNVAIKQFIMDNQIVAGVGNIYAAEVLFATKINPSLAAKQLNLTMCKNLVSEIKKILQDSINHGGTTFKDFAHSDGKLGYFKQQLKVYGRAGLDCKNCNNILQSITQGQRNTVFCPECQK